MEKDTYIQIRLSEKEKQVIFKRAEKEGISASQYILNRILPERIEVNKTYEELLDKELSQ